jgi:hypothetical protein
MSHRVFARRHGLAHRGAFLVTVFAALLVPGGAHAAPTQSPLDFGPLIADLEALPPGADPGSSLLAKARVAQASVERGQPCAALNQLAALRNQLRAKTGKKRLTEGLAAQIQTDVLALDAMILLLPGSEACGGTPGALPTAGFGPEVDVLASDTEGIVLHVTLPQPHLVTRSGGGHSYTDVSMDGMGYVNGVGRPDLPAATRLFAVPLGADVSLETLGSSSIVLDGVSLWPEQPQPVDAERSPFARPPFTIDTKAYMTDAPYPATPSRAGPLGMMRDLQVGGVEFDGAQYNPVTQILRIYTSFDVKISFGGKNSGLFADQRLTSLWNVAFQDVYADTLLNYKVAYANVGPIIRPLFCGEELLIVTSPALHVAADTLATARRADGFPTAIVEVGNGQGQIGTTPGQIQSFIRGELSSICLIRPSYVILLGNTAQVPTFVPTVGGTAIASDLPYGLADDSDLFADVNVGRIPAPDLPTANTVVDKIVDYEDDPPFSLGFYGHATFTSYWQCGLDGDIPCATATTDERGFTKTSETIRDALVAAGYQVDRVYTTAANANPQKYYDGTDLPAELMKPAFPWNGVGQDVIDDWNEGRFIMFHRDHGYSGGWSNPDVSNADIPALTNGALQPVVFSINCASATYDNPANPSFVERILQKSGGGAVAVFGDSRNSPSFTNNHIVLGFFDAIFPTVLGSYGSPTPIAVLGKVLNAGKAYMDTQNGLDFQGATDTLQEHYLYGLFGDPTMQIYRQLPFRFTIEKAVIRFLRPGWVFVGLDQPQADGTLVTLSQEGAPVGRGLLVDGEAQIMMESRVDLGEPLRVSLGKTDFEPAFLDVLIEPEVG